MGERIRRHATAGLLLDAVVADRRRRIERVGDLILCRRLEVAGRRGVLRPHARVAVGLQLHTYGLALRAGPRALGQAAGEVLHPVAVLMRDDVALRERPRARAELRAEIGEEADVEVHLLVVGAVERTHRRNGGATGRLRRAAEEHGRRRRVRRTTPWQLRLPIRLHRVDEADDAAVVAPVRVGAGLTLRGRRAVLHGARGRRVDRIEDRARIDAEEHRSEQDHDRGTTADHDTAAERARDGLEAGQVDALQRPIDRDVRVDDDRDALDREPLHEIDRADLGGLGPARRHDHAVARVDGDGEPISVAIHESTDELGILDGCGPDDDARGARLGEALGGVEVADPAARLDLHGEAVRDLADRVDVPGRARARAVDVDDVQPFRTIGNEAFRRLERRRRDLLDRGEVAARHADDASLIDVDRGIDDHGPSRPTMFARPGGTRDLGRYWIFDEADFARSVIDFSSSSLVLVLCADWIEK